MPEQFMVGQFIDAKKCAAWMNECYAAGYALHSNHAVAGFSGPHSSGTAHIWVIMQKEEAEEGDDNDEDATGVHA